MEIQLRAGHPDVKACAWRWRTGRRNCGYCRPAKDWPPLRHVWPTLAPPARSRTDGQGCGDGARSANKSGPEAEKPAAAEAGRAGEGERHYGLIR